MREKLETLTALRFFAAFVIVIHHLQGVMWIEEGTFQGIPLGSAVSFFFILSGFVLHYSYAGRILKISWLEFSLQRFLRIWPAHVAVIVLCAVWLQIPAIEFQLDRMSWLEVAQIILLAQAWSREMIVFWGLNGPSWSISVELFFYLSFLPLLYALSRIGFLPFLFTVALFTASWLWFSTAFLLDPGNQWAPLALGYISPLARVGEFCLGMAMSHLLSPRLELVRRYPRALWTGLEVLSLLALVMCVGNILTVAEKVRPVLGPVAAQWIGSSGALLSFAFLIGVFAVGGGRLSKLIERPVFVWLGTVSFATYLVHQPLIYHWEREIVPIQSSVSIEVVGYFIVLFGLSSAVHYWVELPGVRLGKSLSRRLSSGKSANPPSHLSRLPTDTG